MYENFAELTGKTITKIDGDRYSEELVFHCSDGSAYRMYHSQGCCESVDIEDIAGDLNDLLDSPVLFANEETSEDQPADVPDPKYRDEYGSNLWTFYRIGTVKGSVTIRWYGTSNGYYSVSVYFKRIKEPDEQITDTVID